MFFNNFFNLQQVFFYSFYFTKFPGGGLGWWGLWGEVGLLAGLGTLFRNATNGPTIVAFPRQHPPSSHPPPRTMLLPLPLLIFLLR